MKDLGHPYEMGRNEIPNPTLAKITNTASSPSLPACT